MTKEKEQHNLEWYKKIFASMGGHATANAHTHQHYQEIGRKGGLAGKGTPRSGRPRKTSNLTK